MISASGASASTSAGGDGGVEPNLHPGFAGQVGVSAGQVVHFPLEGQGLLAFQDAARLAVLLAQDDLVPPPGRRVGRIQAAGAAANTLDNTVLIYLMFFLILIPFLMTQVMQNRGVMLIFIPLAANPIGIVICVQAACLTAFMPPMATAAVPYYMAAGGYDIKSVFKQSVIPAILFCAVSVIWSSIAFPLY